MPINFFYFQKNSTMLSKFKNSNLYISHDNYGLIQVYNQCNEMIKEIDLAKNVQSLATNDKCEVVVANLTDIYVYKFPDFELTRIIETNNHISCIAIGGNLLVVGSKCGNVSLINLSTNEEPTQIIHLDSPIVQTKIIASLNLFSFLTCHGKIYFYNVSSLTLCQTFEVYTTNFCKDIINYMCFSLECGLLAIYSKSKVYFYDKSLGKSVAMFDIFENINLMYLTSVHICKACQYIVTSSDNGCVFIHDFIKGNLIFKFCVFDMASLLVFDNQIVLQTKSNLEGTLTIDIFLADPFSDDNSQCESKYLITEKANIRKDINSLDAYRHCVKNKFKYNKN